VLFYAGLDIIDLTDDNAVFAYETKGPVTKYAVPLIIQEGLQEGARYRFILEASHKDESSYGQVEVTINAGPRNCFVEVCISMKETSVLFSFDLLIERLTELMILITVVISSMHFSYLG